jgi:hypothetical protein
MTVPAVIQNENGLVRWLLNSLILWVALISSALAFHAFGNTIASFTSFFSGTALLVFFLYGLVFAYTYDRISGLWSPRSKRKTLSLFDRGLENERKRNLYIRLLDGIGYSFSVAIIFWAARYMISGGLLGDTDSEGVANTSDLPTIVVILVSAVALEIGGKTESDDDEEDPVSPTVGAKGG